MFNARRLFGMLFVLSGILIFQAAFASTPPVESQGQPIPFKQEKMPVEDGLPKMALGFVICGALFAATIVLLRKRLSVTANGNGVRRNLKILESQRLTTKSSLHVVEFRGTYYLLSQSEAGVQRLASSPADESLQAGAEN